MELQLQTAEIEQPPVESLSSFGLGKRKIEDSAAGKPKLLLTSRWYRLAFSRSLHSGYE